MTNEEFLDQGGVTGEARKRCLKAMATFGEDRWWLSDDPKRRAYGQLHTPDSILLYDMHQFHVDIEALLGRPIFTHEFLRWSALGKEAEEVMAGVVHTEEEKRRASEAGWRVVEEHHTGIISIEVPEAEGEAQE